MHVGVVEARLEAMLRHLQPVRQEPCSGQPNPSIEPFSMRVDLGEVRADRGGAELAEERLVVRRHAKPQAAQVGLLDRLAQVQIEGDELQRPTEVVESLGLVDLLDQVDGAVGTKLLDGAFGQHQGERLRNRRTRSRGRYWS